MTEITGNSYDQIPYESYPYNKSDIGKIYAIAKLFDVDAVDFKKCKVLELGCAAAGNIIPMAIKFPKSEFKGIDLSEVQVNSGIEQIKELGLKNIKIEARSILDIDSSYGKFDYIIVHGIWSWVPENVRTQIFEICKNNLSDNGVAYISYNTLPGWNMVKSVRDMMLYHIKNHNTPQQKVTQGKALLNFINEARGEGADPYSLTIKNELEILKNAADSYIFHDHMEENNHPAYFSEFMGQADGSGLQYLGDAEISNMYLGNMPQKVNETLQQIGNDIVKVEQYMDFITNRRFRMSLICKKNVKINRNITSDRIDNFYFTSNLQFKKETGVKLDENGYLNSKGAGSVTFKTNSAPIIELFKYFHENNNKPTNLDELAKIITKNLKTPNEKKDSTKQELREAITRFILAGVLDFSADSANYVGEISKSPSTSKLAKTQARGKNWVTNQRSTRVGIDSFDKFMLQYLDGANDFDKLVEKMVDHVINKDININKENKPVEDKSEIAKIVTELAKLKLEAYAKNYLLVA